jgi:uncharacterized protein (DUF1499 family)
MNRLQRAQKLGKAMAALSWLGTLWKAGDTSKPSKLAWGALVLAVVPTLTVLALGYAHRIGSMPYQTGFQVMSWAIWVALAGGILGILVVVRFASGARKRGWGPGVIAIIVGIATFAVPAYYVLVLLPHQPWIHDITTDTDNPPAFVAVVPLRLGYPNPATYDGPEVAALQKQAYPDLVPLKITKAPAEVFAAAMDATQALGLQLVSATPQEGRIEASKQSMFFGFVDDVVIRVQPDGTGTRVDVRSKAREGRSDFGVNAARVHRILELIKVKAG